MPKQQPSVAIFIMVQPKAGPQHNLTQYEHRPVRHPIKQVLCTIPYTFVPPPLLVLTPTSTAIVTQYSSVQLQPSEAHSPVQLSSQGN